MNTESTKYLALTTTVPSPDHASVIAQALVEKSLAACVQISGPFTSVYRWEGAIETSTEFRVTAKTTVAAYDQVAATILALHPYDIPEVLAMPIAAGHADYLAWLDSEVSA